MRAGDGILVTGIMVAGVIAGIPVIGEGSGSERKKFVE
jgi:hypothetical protein